MTRLSALCTLAVALLTVAATAQNESFTLSIMTKTPSVLSGAEIRLTIRMTNNLSIPFAFPPRHARLGLSAPIPASHGRDDPLSSILLQATSDRGETMFHLDIRDSKGRTPPYTTYAKSLVYTIFTGNDSPFVLEAKGQFEVPFVLSRYYDLTRPDTYTIVATPRWTTDTPVLSNKLAIKVASPF